MSAQISITSFKQIIKKCKHLAALNFHENKDWEFRLFEKLTSAKYENVYFMEKEILVVSKSEFFVKCKYSEHKEAE